MPKNSPTVAEGMCPKHPVHKLSEEGKCPRCLLEQALSQPRSMTVDELIAALSELKEKSNLKGNAVVHLCIQECPYIPVIAANVENDEDGGSVILLHPEFEP